MSVLVLEASTSSAKAMVYDAERGVVCVRTRAYDAHISNVQTQDADGVLEALLCVGGEAALQSGCTIDCVSVGGTWHSLLMLDPSMRPVTRVYSWAYTGAAAYAQSLRQDAAFCAEVYRRTGCMAHAIYPAFKYPYIKRTLGLADGLLCAGQGDYIFYHLTGLWQVSHAMASGTALLNTHSLCWDARMLDFCGLTVSRLPALVSHEACAPLCAQAAARLHVPAGIPVVPPHPDGAMNQVGAGAMGPGVMTLSVGTSGALRMAFDHPVQTQTPGGTWCYVGPGRWLCGAATSGATNCVEWLVQTVLGGQYDYGALETLAARVTGDYPVFTPFLYGERCPGWRDGALGTLYGLRGETGPGHLYRAVLEGVLMNLYDCYRSLCHVGGAPDVIRVSGGILNSPLWTQMLCDILQHPIQCADMQQASMLGCAALGLHATGHLDDLAGFDPGPQTSVLPDGSKAAHYAERFARYKRLYDADIQF